MNSLHLLHFLQRMIADESRHPLGRALGEPTVLCSRRMKVS